MSINNVSSNSLNSIMENSDFNSAGSVQLMFAKLQLALSEQAKTNATDKMNEIQKAQDDQKEVAALLQQARQLQADAKSSDDPTRMTSEMKSYMDSNDLAYDKTGGIWCHTHEEWEVAIASLQAHQEQLGTNTQQLMVYVQDFMGQYNSYLQGANSSIQESNQTLGSIARGG